MKLLVFLIALASLCPLYATDESKTIPDPFAGAIFPPELVFMARDRIALTQEQMSALRAGWGKAQLQSDQLHKKLEQETAALATLVKQEHLNAAVVQQQLDKVLDIEREVKHLHLGLAVDIKNLLTPEQQARLREILKDKDGLTRLGEDVRKRLAEKVGRIQEGAKKLRELTGQDPTPLVSEAMEKTFKPLMDAGKPIEAEAELDRILDNLNQNGAVK
jgi:hypothetical protein